MEINNTRGKRIKNSDEIMTVAEVAQYLHCSQSTIYRLLKRREIPAFKIGSDWRFLLPDIKQWARDSRIS